MCVVYKMYIALLQIFQPLLLEIRKAVMSSSVLDDNIMEGYFALTELCDVREKGSNLRPLCHLVSGIPYGW